MMSIHELLNVLRDPLWVSVGAIATAVMAIITYLTLRSYRKMERKRENRELIERIIQPAVEALTGLIDIELPNLSDTLSMQSWKDAERQNPLLIFRIEEKLREKIRRFSVEVDELAKRKNWKIELMHIAAKRVIEKLLPPPADRDSATNANRIWYMWRFKNGRQYLFRVEQFIFQDSTLEKEIATSQACNSDSMIDEKSFFMDGQEYTRLTPELFDEALANAKLDLQQNKDLTEILNKFKRLFAEATDLRKRLESFKKKHSS